MRSNQKLNHGSTAKTLGLAAVSLLVLSGCSTLNVENAKLTLPEVRATLQEDKAALTKDVEPLTGPLTLDNAIARAIKYNADRRFRAMEEAVALGTFEAGKFDMLPKLVASAGYRDRNNDLVTRSVDSVTGAPSLANPYISSSREVLTTEVGISWSLLDFGQSYYAAQQNADRVLIASERHRKALNNLVQDVRSAYWRVVAAQKLLPQLRQTIADSEAALKDARKAEDDRIRSPLEPLRYQRQLLENLRLLETIEQELSTGKIELATLANLPLTADYTVVEPSSELSTVWLEQPVDRLEEYALLRNPDLREGIYNARIAQQETRRALLKIFPGLSFNYGVKHSNDDYLIHQNWNEAGAQISFNLLGLLSAPAQLRLADAGVSLANQRRMATQMAVLSQLHIARLQYANTARQYQRADAIAGVDTRIANHITNQAEAQKQSALDRISQQSTAVLSQLRRYQALSNAQAAASRLQATLGMEPAITGSSSMPLDQLTSAVGQSLQAWNRGQLPAIEGGQ
ncbi:MULTISPECIES: TolC family protein [unclassified Duganella]|uniref:TolC family protein n=1 Tax=unclassified Duganella TaxID=2636909 RepID=UPI00088D7501|nr:MULTISPECIES: TolC family protein [unclassified Duganella]SDG01611.1 Outer membrane protein TolC [Duganella sp. OV458]SDJ03582.1 Outer membrane protein TolC [Duganella sp. OV510]